MCAGRDGRAQLIAWRFDDVKEYSRRMLRILKITVVRWPAAQLSNPQSSQMRSQQCINLISQLSVELNSGAAL